jgi:hypothetical protein
MLIVTTSVLEVRCLAVGDDQTPRRRRITAMMTTAAMPTLSQISQVVPQSAHASGA